MPAINLRFDTIGLGPNWVNKSSPDRRMRILEEGGLLSELIAPFRSWTLPIEHSRIQIRFDGSKDVFDIRRDRAGAFKVIHFEHGEWETMLIDLPEPIPM